MRVITGGAETFDALIYHEPHPGTMSYLQNQFENVGGGLGSMVGGFMETARSAWERFGSSEAFQRAKAAVRTISHMWQRDEIKSIWEMASFQQAPLSMQRLLVANPVARQLYIDQRTDGYSDTYVDMYPGKIGWTHYDYQLVTEGMIQTPIVKYKDEEGNEHEEGDFHVEFHFTDMVDDDRPLFVQEQNMMMRNWDNMAALIADGLETGGEDPMSVYANKL
ncbi:hypothetical protein [Burkholderia phage FLC9]|nr:hypothetical protein [Burkholderia phage FLC9]